MSRHFRLITAAVIALMALQATAAEKKDSISYIPQVHGTLRPRVEQSTERSETRFQLRNARVSLNGFIAPMIDYYVQADFCDRGSIKFLDGWIRLAVTKDLRIQAGQFRMPFATDPFRGPHTYIFANRSFIGKDVFNVRAVGAKVSYKLPKIPLTVEAGVFNPSKIGDHTPWNRSLAFASKAVYKLGNVDLSAGYASKKPDSVRVNSIDGAITWKCGRWTAEGEYLYSHYCNRGFRESHAWNAWVDYRMPIKAGIFNRLSFQGRYDGMTAFSSGSNMPDGTLKVDKKPRNRATVGATISYVRTPSMFLDIRANYEKYFYHSGVHVTPDMGDRVTLEMVLRF